MGEIFQITDFAHTWCVGVFEPAEDDAGVRSEIRYILNVKIHLNTLNILGRLI